MQRLESVFKPRSFGKIIGGKQTLTKTETATNRYGHRPKRPQTERATNRKGHKPKRPQTGTATNRNDQRPKRPQTETATNRTGHKLNGHKSSNINCVETWSRVDFFGQIYIRFLPIAFVFFSFYVCHYGALPYVFGLGLLIIWHNIYLTELFDSL